VGVVGATLGPEPGVVSATPLRRTGDWDLAFFGEGGIEQSHAAGGVYPFYPSLDNSIFLGWNFG
jgi:hypothetical protein